MKPILISLLACFLIGCATAHKANELSPGMTQSQVREQMGNPSITQFVGNKLIWKYTLLKPGTWQMKYLPYYLVFDPSTQKLESWYMDEAEFQANQQAQQQQWSGLAQSIELQRAEEERQRQINLENSQRQQAIDLQKKQLKQQQQPQTYIITDEYGRKKTMTVEPQSSGRTFSDPNQ